MDKNEIVTNALLKAGWRYDRQLDKNYILNLFRNAHCPLFECAIDFLQIFGDLSICFKNIENGLENDDINFSIKHALDLESSEYVLENYVPRIHKMLCIIGSAYRDYFTLLMSDDGHVYGGYDYFLCKIGDSGIKAIEAIILGCEFQEIQ